MREKLLQFLAINGFDHMFDQLTEKAIDMHRAGFKAFNQKLPEEAATAIAAACRARRDIYEDSIIAVYAPHFNEEELDTIIAFHLSPLGRKLASIGPQVQSALASNEDTWLRETLKSIEPELQVIFEAAPAAMPEGTSEMPPAA